MARFIDAISRGCSCWRYPVLNSIARHSRQTQKFHCEKSVVGIVPIDGIADVIARRVKLEALAFVPFNPTPIPQLQ